LLIFCNSSTLENQLLLNSYKDCSYCVLWFIFKTTVFDFPTFLTLCRLHVDIVNFDHGYIDFGEDERYYRRLSSNV